MWKETWEQIAETLEVLGCSVDLIKLVLLLIVAVGIALLLSASGDLISHLWGMIQGTVAE